MFQQIEKSSTEELCYKYKKGGEKKKIRKFLNKALSVSKAARKICCMILKHTGNFILTVNHINTFSILVKTLFSLKWSVISYVNVFFKWFWFYKHTLIYYLIYTFFYRVFVSSLFKWLKILYQFSLIHLIQFSIFKNIDLLKIISSFIINYTTLKYHTINTICEVILIVDVIFTFWFIHWNRTLQKLMKKELYFISLWNNLLPFPFDRKSFKSSRKRKHFWYFTLGNLGKQKGISWDLLAKRR